MNTQDLSKVLRYIEENIRISEQTTIDYLDPKSHLDRLKSKQNHVIFGRRGSGKSLLLKSLKTTNPNTTTSISINLEDYKDISFPNSISHVLMSILKSLKKSIGHRYKIWNWKNWKTQRSILKSIDKQISQLEKKISEPDSYNEKIREKSASKLSGKLGSSLGKSNAEMATEMADELETSREILKDKLNELKNEISSFKELINSICTFTNKDIFLILDDLYFIKKNEQPFFIDFFHRISKNTRLYLKIATIKQRSSLYLQTDTFIGVEIGHDIQALSLDYTLEDFNNLVSFMRQLLNHINQKVNVDINYSNVLTENAFRFLCLASGGVPRDFLTLFISLGEKMINGNRNISKPNVIDCSIENLPNKMEAFNTDSAEEKTVLEHYLQYIRNQVINTKKWNAFLVSNSDVDNFPKIKQAIKELVDLRLIHLVNPNISSAPSDGKRYSAYMVDIGLFPNSNPRGFTQIEPGQRDENNREDKLRSAPKLNLTSYEDYISSQNLTIDLQTTEN
jgi:energy-coupling factor transporter ATP-binding protein EcfA2